MIPVTKPYLPKMEKYNKYVESIYDRCWLTNNGPLVQELTKRLQDYLGVKNVILVNNGTIALNLAFKLLKIKKKVVTTPFSFVATSNSLAWDGLGVKFSEISAKSFNLDAAKLAARIDSDCEALLPVHVFGNACDVEMIDVVAKKSKLRVIYDAAHAFGVKFKNSSVLNYGDISTLSFHATKLFHTVEGGAVIIKDDNLFEEAKQLINFGLDQTGRINHVGTNAKMSEFHAAMGLSMLDDVPEIMKRRSEISNFYTTELKGPCTFQEKNPNSTNNFSYFPALFKDEATLKRVVEALGRVNIIPRRYFFPSLDTLSYLSDSYADDVEMQISRDISSRILCLPLYYSLKDEEAAEVVRIIKNATDSN